MTQIAERVEANGRGVAGADAHDAPLATRHPEYPVERARLGQTLAALDAYVDRQVGLAENAGGADEHTTAVLRARFGARAGHYRRAQQEAPYFARIDFRPKGAAGSETYYLGL